MCGKMLNGYLARANSALWLAVRNYHPQEGREGISQLLSPVCWYALIGWWWISWKSVYSWVTACLLTSLNCGLGSYHLSPLGLLFLLLHNHYTPKAPERHTGLSAALLDCEGKGKGDLSNRGHIFIECYSTLIFFKMHISHPLHTPILEGITSWEPGEGSMERNFLFSEVHFLYTKLALLIDSWLTRKQPCCTKT